MLSRCTDTGLKLIKFLACIMVPSSLWEMLPVICTEFLHGFGCSQLLPRRLLLDKVLESTLPLLIVGNITRADCFKKPSAGKIEKDKRVAIYRRQSRRAPTLK